MSDLERVLDFSSAFLPRDFPGTDRLCVITLTNLGYVPMCLNMVRSLGRCGYKTQGVAILCTDEPTVEAVRAAGPQFSPVLFPADVCRGQARYDTPKFAQIMRAKVLAIRACLELERDVVYSDGDVVWLKGGGIHRMEAEAFPYGRSHHIKPVFQNDGSEAKPVYCGGLLLAPCTVETMWLYDPVKLPSPPSPKFDDQRWINERLGGAGRAGSARILPAGEFLSGKWLRERLGNNRRALDAQAPYALHLNWMVGKDKQNMLTHLDLWIAEEERGS